MLTSHRKVFLAFVILPLVLLIFLHYNYPLLIRIGRPIPRQKLGDPSTSPLPPLQNMTDLNVLRVLGQQFQSVLENIQNATNCSNVTTSLVCGHNNGCGLACQVHHRMACAMLSYALHLPWIHDTRHYWPYKNPWTEFFQPVGTRCLQAEKHVSFRDWSYYRKHLLPGLPVPADLAKKVNATHPNPFLWFLGQYLRFTYKLKSETVAKIEELKQSIGITSRPALGIHVRRTDKAVESPLVPSGKFINAAKSYLEKRLSTNSERSTVIFVASDDHTILPVFQQRLNSSNLKITGFPSNKTYARMLGERTHHLFDIIRDLAVLADCEHVICTFSSNICRMVLEMKIAAGDPESSVQSLDGEYHFRIYQAGLLQPKIMPRQNGK